MLSGYLKGLEENYFVSSTGNQSEDEIIPFLPAFWKLIEHVKAVHPDVRINYKNR